MSLPIHLQAEVDSVCEAGLEYYISQEHKKQRRSFIEDGILSGTALSGLSYLGFKQNYLPNYFIPIPLVLNHSITLSLTNSGYSVSLGGPTGLTYTFSLAPLR